ncbi:hypothetical protein [Geobacter sp. SVR]|uniref:hypothetical protein n=1 Tax=Geobacter sp. SVR TaxID=2495594 RepID=UPI00143EFEC9|nr:hypothetical protein [Geobacter sp. SVR]BCS55929.1 hypothetical protein GSVR_42370 [Geobacter sp. SVR]GCF84692.1 hypothetical protein GSbR_12920 [Geobacter sp. SVR]
MKIRLYEDYYHWCCDWCDSENSVLWAKIQEPVYCGACHRVMHLGGDHPAHRETWISAGLCHTAPASG